MKTILKIEQRKLSEIKTFFDPNFRRLAVNSPPPDSDMFLLRYGETFVAAPAAASP